MLDKADEYIKKYDLDQSAEELFIEFERIVRIRQEFERHFRALPEHLRPCEEMQRSKRMLEKRKMFVEWYMLKNDHRFSKEVVTDLAEITFMSTRNIYKTLGRDK